MRPMTWKELRENSHWTALSLLVVALVYAFEIGQNGPLHTSTSGNVPLIYPPYLGSGTMLAPLIGMLLGMVQIMPELKRDQWAFLMHRPLSRTVLFWGKVVPGLLLYLAATLIPLLVATAWIISHYPMMAPFNWRMLQPGLADILTGCIFYFAGILAAVRPARWYGSRFLPVLSALLFAVLLFTAPRFSQTVLLAIIILAVMIVAACGSFAAIGQYRAQSRLEKFCLGVSLLGGLFSITFILATISGSYLVSWLDNAAYNSSLPPRAWTRTEYGIHKDGDVVRLRRTFSFSNGSVEASPSQVTAMTSLNGNFKSLGLNPPSWDPSLLEPKGELGSGSRGSGEKQNYRDIREAATILDLDTFGQNQSYRYFYSHHERRIVVYSIREKRASGYMGPAGFYTAGAEPAEGARFSGPMIGMYAKNTFWFPDGVYSAWPAEHRVVKVTSDTPDHRIRGVAQVGGFGKYERFMLVLRDKQIEAWSTQGDQMYTLPLEAPLNSLPYIHLYYPLSGGRYMLWFSSSSIKSVSYSERTSYVHEITYTGKVLRRFTLPPLAYQPVPQTIRDSTMAAFYGVVFPTNAAWPLMAMWGLNNHESGMLGLFGPDFLTALSFKIGIAVGLLSLIPAVLIARRCVMSRSGTAVWLVTVFLFGINGLLLMLAIQEWPARVKCPACGKLRDVHREHCEHCEASFPAPVRDGTEIFA